MQGWPFNGPNSLTSLPFPGDLEPEKNGEETKVEKEEEEPVTETAAEEVKGETENGKPEDAEAEQEEEDDQEYEVVDDAEAVKGEH